MLFLLVIKDVLNFIWKNETKTYYKFYLQDATLTKKIILISLSNSNYNVMVQTGVMYPLLPISDVIQYFLTKF